MVFAALLRRQPHVASRFARHNVAVAAQGSREVAARRSRGNLTRYAAMTSS